MCYRRFAMKQLKDYSNTNRTHCLLLRRTVWQVQSPGRDQHANYTDSALCSQTVTVEIWQDARPIPDGSSGPCQAGKFAPLDERQWIVTLPSGLTTQWRGKQLHLISFVRNICSSGGPESSQMFAMDFRMCAKHRNPTGSPREGKLTNL